MADEVINPIPIGFPWWQGFELDAGVLQPGDELLVEFRLEERDAAPLFALGTGAEGGATIDGALIDLEISSEKSALIPAPAPTRGFVLVLADFIRIPLAGEPEWLRAKAEIPAILPVTRAPA